MFRPARIDVRAHSYLGLMSDVSADGAGFVCPLDLAVGDLISVGTGDEPLRPARVVWKSDARFGVQFEAFEGAAPHCKSFSYRSARVPVDIDAKVYVNGVPRDGKIVNLSPRGMALETSAKLATGSLLSVVALGQEFANVTARWSHGGIVGARLPAEVHLTDLQRLITESRRRASRAPKAA